MDAVLRGATEVRAVVRGILIAVSAALGLTACAVSNAPYPRAVYSLPGAQSSPPGPNIYTMTPRVAPHGELLACGFNGSNIGALGSRRESLVYTPYIATPAGALLRFPAEAACLSSGFGWRGAADGGGRQHTGLDLANASGGFIYAAADGRVVSFGWRGGYGLVLELDHGAGVRTLYAHLNEIDPNLAQGSFVAAGAPVARMGMTGNATGIHLHYEVSVNGLVVDPLFYGLPQAAAYDVAPPTVSDLAPSTTDEFETIQKPAS